MKREARMPDEYPNSLQNAEVLPGAQGATVELSEIFVKGKDFMITFTFRRGQVCLVKNLMVKIVDNGNGTFTYDTNWRKLKGWLDHDCNLMQLGADRWIPRLKERFAGKAQAHINVLAQQRQG